MFESLVNLEGCKTKFIYDKLSLQFESLVNLEGCKTCCPCGCLVDTFESLVNLEGCKTIERRLDMEYSLRVLLI